MKALVLYLPAIHAGYINFFKMHSNADIFLIDDSIIENLASLTPYYGRDVRAISSADAKKIVEALGIFSSVGILTAENIEHLQSYDEIVMPEEDISEEVIKKFGIPEGKVKLEKVFLRWNRKITEREYEVKPEETITREEFDQNMIMAAQEEAERTSDWWRQVGAVIVKNGEVVSSSYNLHMPHNDNPNVLGDPRSVYDAGERYDLASSVHAEASAIANAAKEGKKLEGASIYITVFPCPTCAKLISKSGIKKLYFRDGYSLLDAEDVLKSQGVKIIRVK